MQKDPLWRSADLQKDRGRGRVVAAKSLRIPRRGGGSAFLTQVIFSGGKR